MEVLRSIRSEVLSALVSKIVLLAGPRQVGKTFLSKKIFTSYSYYNYDIIKDRKILRAGQWDRDGDLIIFDEIHKMKSWKSWLKGIYDGEGVRPPILVTGSARLDIFRKGGDSLAGRHRLIRLHPFSVKELNHLNPEIAVDRLIKNSGFPEPFFLKTEREVALWRRSHLDVILREDLLDLEKVRDIRNIEILIDLLSERVGSSISYSSLAEDLSVSSHTVKHWIQILEYLNVVFIVHPYSKRLSKAIQKQPKIYFYDIGRVENGDAAKIENLCACHLLKRNNFLTDSKGEKRDLFYLRDKEKREVDFLTVKNQKIEYLIEVKSSDDHFSPSLNFYHQKLLPEMSIQLVYKLKHKQSLAKDKIIVKISDFLAGLET